MKGQMFIQFVFWTPNLFCAFHDYVRGGTVSLAIPDGTSLVEKIVSFMSC